MFPPLLLLAPSESRPLGWGGYLMTHVRGKSNPRPPLSPRAFVTGESLLSPPLPLEPSKS